MFHMMSSLKVHLAYSNEVSQAY